MAKNFRLLQEKMSPERRARVEATAQKLIDEMPLDELREARNMTQEHLAEILNISQAAVSKMERRTDIYLSTLERFITAMGGHLQIRAIFPEGFVNILRLGDLSQQRKIKRAAKHARMA